jgi:1-deoxyxylulose-5-phosphate synthase
MDYVNLGRTGLRVSRLCLGAMTYGTPEWRPWVLDEEQSRPFIAKALEHGITFFDTADMYSLGRSEEVLGRAVRDFARRDQVVLATKVYFEMSDDPNDRGLSRKHLMASIDGSLRRLGTDYVDLYQIHRWDDDTPIEETLAALSDIVRAGKARYIGASSMAAWQFTRALYLADRHGWVRFASMQNHYNLIYREEEREMIPLCLHEGVGVLPWSPLARGRLAGRASAREQTTRGTTDTIAQRLYDIESDAQIIERVTEVAARRGVSAAQVALAWLLSKPGVTAPIVGASKMYQLDEAIAALSIALSDEERAQLEGPYSPHPIRW